MRINHNIAALNTYRQLSANTTNTSKSLEKLSSGLRINKASDDAVGLAISEKMRGQIRGLDQASSNAQNAISLLQTAEGALNETHSILQRIRELAVQSATDTNTTSDRAEIQKELDQLLSEVDRISTTTEFNTKKLLNGDSGTKVIYTSNPKIDSATVINDNIVAGTYTATVTTAAEVATTTGSAFVNGDITLNGTQSVTINGSSISFTSVSGNAATTASNFIAALNNASLGLTASGGVGGLIIQSNEYGAQQSVSITANAISAELALTVDAVTNKTDSGVDVIGTINGAAATGTGRTLISTTGNSIGLKLTLTASAASTAATADSVQVTKNALTAHIGANNAQTMTLNISSMKTVDLSINGLLIDTQGGAETAITTVQAAIELVSSERSKLGAYTNRLEHTIANLGTSSENMSAAESRIRDVDMAKEMMEFTKNNILSQAAQAMLAQANQQPQGVLQLLR